MIDDANAFVAAAEALKDKGASRIYILCKLLWLIFVVMVINIFKIGTHGLMSSDAPMLIESSPVDEVVVTNTVPHDMQKLQCVKIKTVDISVLLAEAIRRIHHSESMSFLFKNVTQED